MTISAEDKAHYVSIWAKVVDTQMHFNEMSVKARQFGLAFVAAALGLGVVMLTRGGQEFSLEIPFLGGFRLHATVLIALTSALSLYAVRLLDLNVYHRMLRGSVAFGEDFEQNYMKQIFDLEKGMTQTISHFSRYDDADKAVEGNGKYHYTGVIQRNSEEKIKAFYCFSITSLIILALGLFVITSDLKILRPHTPVGSSALSNLPTGPSAAVPGASPGANANGK
jgi:hypothetical protein